MSLQNSLLDIGIAADFFARLTVSYPTIKFSISQGQLRLENTESGFVLTQGASYIEPTAEDWRQLMVIAGKI